MTYNFHTRQLFVRNYGDVGKKCIYMQEHDDVNRRDGFMFNVEV